jgi:metal-responsive CopG/Arc/MetJ family transcriptional regulator
MLAPNQPERILMMSEKRVVVLMPQDMAEFLDKKAKDSGMGNTSSLLRYIVRQMMNDEALPKIGRANA